MIEKAFLLSTERIERLEQLNSDNEQVLELLGFVRAYEKEVEQEKQTLALEKQFFDNLVTRSQEIEDRLTDQVDELQKALKQWEDFANHLSNITSCSMTKNEIRQALNTFVERTKP